MKKNWKTTLFGAIAAIGSALTQSDKPAAHVIGQILLAAGTLLLGATAKDRNVTGGTVEQ